jgi:mannose-1-phosphate guanylyltransferase
MGNTRLQELKAVILVGGPGTRLQPLTDETPKSVLPVLNRPFMEYTLAYLKQFDIEDIILTLSYLPEVIRDHFGDGSQYGVHLTYCLEKEPLGTAGAVKNAEAYLDSTFVTLNGDVFTDMDLDDMFALHRNREAVATISLSQVDDPSAFGVVETDGDQRVKRFIEKPPAAEATTNWINAGTYILEPEVLEYIPVNSHYMFERGLFPGLLNMGEPVYGYPFRGYWLDMGTPEKYATLNRDLLSSKTNSPLINSPDADRIYCEPDVIINPTARMIAPVMIGRACRLGQGVYIKGPVVIGADCILEEGARVENAVLWDNVHVGAGARLSQCIVSRSTSIEPNKQVINCVVTPSQTVPLSEP